MLNHPLGLLARKLNNHVPLSPEDQAAVLALPHTLRSLPPHSFLVREGEAPDQCAVLVSGYVIRNKTLGNGARQIVSVHIPGEAVDLQHLFLDCADHNVEALTKVEVALVPLKALRDLVNTKRNVGHAITVSNQIDASIFREWVLNVGRRDARQRLAHLFCELVTRLHAQKLVDAMRLELPMSQEQLADATGLTPVHVNRTLMALQQEGLITRSKRSVTFPDWQRLQTVAEFSDLYLHLGQQKAASHGWGAAL